MCLSMPPSWPEAFIMKLFMHIQKYLLQIHANHNPILFIKFVCIIFFCHTKNGAYVHPTSCFSLLISWESLHVNKNGSNSWFLNFSTIDILGCIILCCRRAVLPIVGCLMVLLSSAY